MLVKLILLISVGVVFSLPIKQEQQDEQHAETRFRRSPDWGSLINMALENQRWRWEQEIKYGSGIFDKKDDEAETTSPIIPTPETEAMEEGDSDENENILRRNKRSPDWGSLINMALENQRWRWQQEIKYGSGIFDKKDDESETTTQIVPTPETESVTEGDAENENVLRRNKRSPDWGSLINMALENQRWRWQQEIKYGSGIFDKKDDESETTTQIVPTPETESVTEGDAENENVLRRNKRSPDWGSLINMALENQRWRWLQEIKYGSGIFDKKDDESQTTESPVTTPANTEEPNELNEEETSDVSDTRSRNKRSVTVWNGSMNTPENAERWRVILGLAAQGKIPQQSRESMVGN